MEENIHLFFSVLGLSLLFGFPIAYAYISSKDYIPKNCKKTKRKSEDTPSEENEDTEDDPLNLDKKEETNND